MAAKFSLAGAPVDFGGAGSDVVTREGREALTGGFKASAPAAGFCVSFFADSLSASPNDVSDESDGAGDDDEDSL